MSSRTRRRSAVTAAVVGVLLCVAESAQAADAPVPQCCYYPGSPGEPGGPGVPDVTGTPGHWGPCVPTTSGPNPPGPGMPGGPILVVAPVTEFPTPGPTSTLTPAPEPTIVLVQNTSEDPALPSTVDAGLSGFLNSHGPAP